VQRDEKSQKQESLQLQPKQVTVETNKKTFAKENAKLTKEIKQLPKPSKKAQLGLTIFAKAFLMAVF
jgi:hypothetical protein